jgi:pimeloyl-ACP methyl ester carboxylesterase
MTTEAAQTADTIVLIHGLWLTGLSWEHWVQRFESQGYKVIARSWPGMEGDIEALRRDPSPINNVGVSEVVNYYTGIIRECAAPPIIIGHSFGGLVTQILLDRGLGAAGVSLGSAPPKGILFLPPSSLKAAGWVLANPFNAHKGTMINAEHFHYGFTNTFNDDEAKAAYERYAAPGANRCLFQGAFAALHPHAVTKVNFHNDLRAPLLLIHGDQDHISPPAIGKPLRGLYKKSTAITAYKEYAGRAHFMAAQTGWEEIADYAVSWAKAPVSS